MEIDMKQIVVLGSGLVGGPIALDLANNPQFKVMVADMNQDALRRVAKDERIQTFQADFSHTVTLVNLIAHADLVVSAVPGFMGYNTLKAIIETGKDVVDIAFSPENTLALQELAAQHDSTAIVDSGVAPGMSNLLIGQASIRLDHIKDITIYVGGLPRIRQLPFEYKAVFSPVDVIEEYTRPARLVRNGRLITREALSEVEYIDFPGLGTLEAFISDGLRSLIHTIQADQMTEKTLRYPGHAAKMKFLRDMGLFAKDTIAVGEHTIAPLDLTAKLLFPFWKLKEGEEDLTLMRITVTGQRADALLKFQYDLFDSYDRKTGIHSMARTTGYTAVMAAYLILEQRFNEKGVFPLEIIGKNTDHYQYILNGLRQRNVICEEKIEKLSIEH